MKPRPLIPDTPEWRDKLQEAVERMGGDDPWEGMTDEEIKNEREEFKRRDQERKAAMKAKYDAGRDERRRSYFSRVYRLSMEDFTAFRCKAPGLSPGDIRRQVTLKQRMVQVLNDPGIGPGTWDNEACSLATCSWLVGGRMVPP